MVSGNIKSGVKIFNVTGNCLAYETVASGTTYTTTISGCGTGTLDGIITSATLGGVVTVDISAEGISGCMKTVTLNYNKIVGSGATNLITQSRLNQYFSMITSPCSGSGTTTVNVYVDITLSNNYTSYTIGAYAHCSQGEYVTYSAYVNDSSKIAVTLTYVR